VWFLIDSTLPMTVAIMDGIVINHEVYKYNLKMNVFNECSNSMEIWK
jgi:hypothetical protein